MLLRDCISRPADTRTVLEQYPSLLPSRCSNNSRPNSDNGVRPRSRLRANRGMPFDSSYFSKSHRRSLDRFPPAHHFAISYSYLTKPANARHRPPPRALDLHEILRVGGRVHAVVRLRRSFATRLSGLHYSKPHLRRQ